MILLQRWRQSRTWLLIKKNVPKLGPILHCWLPTSPKAHISHWYFVIYRYWLSETNISGKAKGKSTMSSIKKNNVIRCWQIKYVCWVTMHWRQIFSIDHFGLWLPPSPPSQIKAMVLLLLIFFLLIWSSFTHMHTHGKLSGCLVHFLFHFQFLCFHC